MPTASEEVESNRSYASDPRWLLAHRIARSRTFARSEQLPKLLLHLCRMTLSGRAEELNEQRIGVAVFRRAPSYDSMSDGIVRSHATRLRNKLEVYYREEGGEEMERIEVPRGGYVPRFYRIEPTAPAPEIISTPPPLIGVAVEPPPLPATSPSLSLPLVALLFCVLQLAFGVAIWRYFASHNQATNIPEAQRDPVVQRFWQTLFAPQQRTAIVTGDSGLVLYETLTSQNVSLAEYLAGTYRDPVHSPARGTPRASREFLLNLANRSYTSIADVRLVESFARLPQWNPAHAQVISARNLQTAEAGEDNLILLGSRQANPWISIVEPKLKFVLKRGDGDSYIFENRNPAAGEQPGYAAHAIHGNVGGSETYGHIAYLPNPGGKGYVLTLDGTWNSGTLSAGNFVLHNSEFDHWLASIVRPNGSIPAFEILLRATDVQNTPTETKVIVSRIIPEA